MVQKDMSKIDELFDLPKFLSLSIFEEYIAQYLERKADKKLAIQELDRIIGTLQNHILSLSLFIKQSHLLNRSTDTAHNSDALFYTKQEVAIKYRVSVRTVNNWMLDGLQTTEIGGVKRISEQAVQEFVKKNKTKKFNWRSIARNV